MATVRGEQTRDRILEAAWGLVADRGASDVTMADVARAAGVTRQLVYFHFDTRAGLLVAMARHRDHVSGFLERVAATRQLPPVEALAALLAAWVEYVPAILPVARALEAGMARGEDEAAAWRDRMTDLREAFRLAVERVHAEGRLAATWTVDDAADWIWARSHLANHQHLVVERGWDADHYAQRTIASVLGDVVAHSEG